VPKPKNGLIDFERWMYGLLEKRRRHRRRPHFQGIEAQSAGAHYRPRSRDESDRHGRAGTDTTANMIGQWFMCWLSDPSSSGSSASVPTSPANDRGGASPALPVPRRHEDHERATSNSAA